MSNTRWAEAAACDISVMIIPSWPIGKNTYIRYMVNFCHSPIVSVPYTICCPPKYSTATCPRLPTRKTTGNRKEKMRATFSICSRWESTAASKRACSCGSCTKALTSLRPARFSCSTVFSAERRFCNSVNNGCEIIPKPMNRMNAIGSMGSTTSVSCQLVTARTISALTSSRMASSSIVRPWPMNRRSRSTSSVARIINCPVWLRSW